MAGNVIFTCALTGSGHTPSMSPYLPYTVGDVDRYKGQFRYDWEEPYLESTRAEPFVSTYADIEYMLKVIGPQTGTRFEAEAYDTSHLYTLAYYMDAGLVPAPVFVQTIFGTMGGTGPDVDHIVHMKRTADRLLGDAYQWSTLGAGRYQMGIVTAAAIMGSHVRVGLEDSLYLGKGQIAESNAHQMTSANRLAATCELMFLHVSDGRVTPMPPAAASAVTALAARQAALPRPGQAGRHVGIPGRAGLNRPDCG